MKDKAQKKKSAGGARPIKTERDYKGAASVAKKLISESKRESAAEQRLQALIEAMEKFDEVEDESGGDDPAHDLYNGPRRRWSDDSSDSE